MILKVENISKFFGNQKVVNNLSFSVDKGDIVGLLGPNGAGKTTTMRMITSYHYPTTGKVYINGKDTQKHTLETQKSIGYLPENNPLYYDMLVVDYLLMTLKFANPKLKHNLALSKVESIAMKLDIYNKLGKPINELSKGYKQRVGIAGSLLHDPDLLVLDEPSEGLDINQKIEMRKLIKTLAQDKAIIISTHVLEEINAVCNRVIVINKGELIKDAKPEELGESKTLVVKLEGSNVASTLREKFGKNNVEILRKGNIKIATIKAEDHIETEISKLIGKNNWTMHSMERKDSLEDVFENLKTVN